MKKSFLLAICLYGLLAFTTSLHAQTNIAEWKILDAAGDIQSNTPYRLKNINTACNSFLAYYHRNAGISLAFNQAQQDPNIRFEKEGGSAGPIMFDERIAIHVGGGGYIHYSSSAVGINLAYSSTPIYVWKFRDNSVGPQQSKIIKASDVAGLFNTFNEGYMVYGSRDLGPNLDWADKPSTSILVKETSFIAPETTVMLSLRAGPFSTPSYTARCSGRITWTFVPVNLTGDHGKKDKTFVIDKFYESVESTTGPKEWWCFFNDAVTDLKAGTWKIIVQTGAWSTECQLEIGEKISPLSFELNKQGCVNAFQPQMVQFQPQKGPTKDNINRNQ